MSEPRQVRTRNLIAYGMGDIFGGGSFILLGLLFFFFLTEVVGLPPWVAGVVTGVGKMWDAISDPIMGYLSDNTRSRYGRRRLYFLLAIPPIAISFYLLWIPVNASSVYVSAAYYVFAYILFNTAFTMVMVPYSALNAEMSTDYRVRTRLTAARTIFSLISAALAGTLAPAIRDNASTPEQGYFWIALIFALLYSLPWLVVFFGTWEQQDESQTRGRQSFHLGRIFRATFSLLRNRSFRTHLLMYVCAYTAMDVLLILFQYYIKWVIGRPITAHTMGALMGAQILTIPVYVWIANKRGKGVAFRVGLAIFAVGMSLAYFLASDSPMAMILAVCALIGAGLSAAVMMPWAILPSIIDVDEAMTGEVRSGMYSGAMTLTRKFVQGLIATQVISISLTVIGYVESSAGVEQVQTPETVAGIKLLFFAMPSVFIVLGFLASLRFRITPATHGVLSAELDRLRAGGSKDDATAEAREVLEQLTGVPYDELYPARSGES